MGALQRPDPILEPVQQSEIIGQSTEEGLDKMSVGLDEPGDQPKTFKINYLGPLWRRLIGAKNRCDFSILYVDTALDLGTRSVARKDDGTSEKGVHAGNIAHLIFERGQAVD
jgi:hypothetical protein